MYRSIINGKNTHLIQTCVLSGLQSQPVIAEDGLTVLIDSEKYQEISTDSNKTNVEVCGDLQTEEYRKCGKKCVLACRLSPFPSDIIVSKDDCDEMKCVEGCFCKDGFVRYQNECILAKECPMRMNKAMRMMSESNKTESYGQNKAQNHTQAQIMVQNMNQTQVQFQGQNPKIFGFGFFNRPGCGFGGCAPVPVQVHSYDETVQRKENRNKGSYILLSVRCLYIKSEFSS